MEHMTGSGRVCPEQVCVCVLQYGEEAVKEGVGAGGMAGGVDMFSELFGGGGRRQRGPRKGEDVVHRLTVSLKDFYMGTSKCGALAVPY